MQEALEKTEWLSVHCYSFADVILTAYIDRLERLGMAWVMVKTHAIDWKMASYYADKS